MASTDSITIEFEVIPKYESLVPNFNVTGNDTYIVNNVVVHNK